MCMKKFYMVVEMKNVNFHNRIKHYLSRYNEKNVIEIISPPIITNTIGVCFVKEVEKYINK